MQPHQARPATSTVRLLTWLVSESIRLMIGRCLGSDTIGGTTVGCMAGLLIRSILESPLDNRFSGALVAPVFD